MTSIGSEGAFGADWAAARGAPEVSALSPLVLAYVGDAVYEMFVRVRLATSVNGSVNRLHMRAVEFSRSASQADVVRSLHGALTERERDIVRRGRNAKSGFVPKNADVVEYRYATGFEALIGYLYLRNENDRLRELLNLAIERVNGRSGEKSAASAAAGEAGGKSAASAAAGEAGGKSAAPAEASAAAIAAASAAASGKGTGAGSEAAKGAGAASVGARGIEDDGFL